MADFSIGEMQEMQRILQEKYKRKWEPVDAATGRNKLLWMVGEIGEVIDIVKKNGGERAASDPALRAHLVEELADVLMYYNDVLLCYGISPDELKAAYTAKDEYLLSGRVYCGYCGSAMCGHRLHPRKDVYYNYYSCSKKERIPGAKCQQKMVRREILENWVLQILDREVFSDEGSK